MEYEISFLVKNLALHEGQERADSFGKRLTELSSNSKTVSEDIIREVLPDFDSQNCVKCSFTFITTWKHNYLL